MSFLSFLGKVAHGDSKAGGGAFGFLDKQLLPQSEQDKKKRDLQPFVAKQAGNAAKSTAQYTARIPETAARSGADLLYNKAVAPAFNLPKQNLDTPINDPLRKAVYGTDELKTYQSRAQGVHDVHPGLPAPLVAAGLAGLDLTPFGKGSSISKKLVEATDAAAVKKLLPGIEDTKAKAIASTKDPHVIENIIHGQSKLPSPAPTIQDITTPGEAAGKAGKGSELPVVTDMHDILNSGGTVDEALNHHMETTGGTIGHAQVALNKLLQEKGSSLSKGSINSKLNPEFDNVKLPEVQPGDSHGAILNGQFIHNKVVEVGNKALKAIDKLSPTDLKLMDELRTSDPIKLAGKAENPAEFRAAADAVKQYNDFTHAAGSGFLGQEVPYRQNYGAPLLLDTSTEESKNALEAAKAKLKTQPGYGQQRHFQDYNEAASHGLNRLHENFAQDLAHDVAYRSSDLSQLALAKGLEEAHPGQVKVGEIGSTPEGYYKQLNIPGGGKISMPANIADDINKRAIAPQASGALGKYDTINAGLKYVKLGGGSFHAITEQGNFIGQQLVSGKLFTNPSATAKSFKIIFSDKTYMKEVERLQKEGTYDNAKLSGLTALPEQIRADVSVSKKTLELPVIKQIHDAIFKRQIPYMKLKIFEQKTAGLNIHNPEDAANMRKVALELNQNYGGFNRAVQGLSPQQFKRAARILLATDFTEGKVRTVIDAASKGGVDGKLAREMVAGKALIFAGLATGAAAAGGELSGKDPGEVAKAILSKFIDPKFNIGDYTASLPATHISEFTKPFTNFFNDSQDKFGGIKNYATGRLAAIPSEANQLVNNQDFSKQHIYGSDTKGRPISPEKAALNIASGVTPIPASQAIKTGTGQQNVGAAVANTVGLRTYPKYDASRLPITQQTLLEKLQKSGAKPQEIKADTQLFSFLQKSSRDLKSTNTDINKALAKGDVEKAQKLASEYNQRLVKTLKPWATKDNVKYLNEDVAKEVKSSLINLDDSSIKSRLQSILNNPHKYNLKIPAGGIE